MARKMYEVADLENGVIVCRGGIKTSLATAEKWAQYNRKHGDENCVVVEADENAITYSEYQKECALFKGILELKETKMHRGGIDHYTDKEIKLMSAIFDVSEDKVKWALIECNCAF